MNKRHQKGYVWRIGHSWFARYYQDELETVDGISRVVRRQHAERLCEYNDAYRSKADVRPLLEEKLRPINERRSGPEGTLSVVDYAEKYFLPYAERELKPSTANGYHQLFRTYLAPHLGSTTLRDFRCVDATNLLAAVHRKHDLKRKSLRHCKGLLGTIFTHAKRAGVIDGLNPARDAGIPRAAAASVDQHAYSLEETLALLNTLSGVARGAVALMYFCGLRPGEARAARWQDLDLERRTLCVRASRWRTHTTTPKTEGSAAVVPFAEMLADILAEMPHLSEFILAGPSGVPVDLHNLASRVVRPALQAAGLAWFGWYALRRGLATLATSIESPLAAKSLLRHTNIQTTAAHYIKSVPEEAARAVEKIDALLDRGGTAPN